MIENDSDYISPSDIQTILSGTLTRLHVLLSPLCKNLPFGTSPTAADIVAATETLRLCNTFLSELRSRCSLHDMKSKDWLDNTYWKTFSAQCRTAADRLRTQGVKGVDALPLRRNGDASTPSTQAKMPQDKTLQGKSLQERAIENFMDVFKSLDETTRNITLLVSRKNRWDDLFGGFATQQLYGEIATELYNKFIAARGVNHIQQMKSLATMYEVLREQADGACLFYGPEYDKLLFGTCGIRYNKGDKPRSRYHRVEERWKEMYSDSTSIRGSHDNRNTRPQEYYDMRAFVRERLSGGKTSRRDAPVPDGFKYNTL